jgi:Domain of unknown function (DUF4349)
MPDLEMLIREVRPAPHPGWAAKLDARVAARFPKPTPAWKKPLIAFREHFLALSAVATVGCALLAFVLVAAPNMGGSDDAEPASSGSASAPAMREESADKSGGGASTAAAPESDRIRDFSLESRAVISSATLTLSTTPDKVNTVNDRAIRVVDGLGGYVQTSRVDASGNQASATLVVKIPSAKLDSGIAELSKLAHVKGRSQQAEDVTDQREVLEARVRDARADREGLRVRLSKATTDAERSKLRAQLDRASRRVTQRQRTLNELGQAVSFATVELTIDGDRRGGAVAPPGGRWTPGDAVGDAVRVLEVIAGVLVITLAVLLPIALIAGLGAFAGRILVRHRRERALDIA